MLHRVAFANQGELYSQRFMIDNFDLDEPLCKLELDPKLDFLEGFPKHLPSSLEPNGL